MTTTRRALAALLALALAGCARTPVDTGAFVVAPLGDASAATRSDPASIEGARVEGDRLHLRVSFGGGCRTHHFGLRFDPVFLESDPVQSTLRLTHDAHGDRCRAHLTRELVFDLTPLKTAYLRSYGGTGGTIDLRVYPPASAEPHPSLLRYRF